MRPGRARTEEIFDHAVWPEGLSALKTVRWTATLARGRLRARLLPPRPAEIAGWAEKISDWARTVHGADRVRFKAWLAQIRRGAAPRPALDYRLEPQPGAIVWVRHWIGAPAKSRTKNRRAVPTLIGVIQLIAGEKQIEADGVRALENERLHLGQELHDETCQLLAGLACLTQALENSRGRADSAALRPLLQDLGAQLSASLARIRTRAHSLVPAPALRHGLAAALRKLAAQSRLLYGVKIALRMPSRLHRHSENHVVQLHGIALESIANAIKHGRASALRITLRARGKNHVFEIEDDGRGLRAVGGEPAGIGLLLMNRRASLLGASLAVTAVRPHGARVRVHYSVA